MKSIYNGEQIMNKNIEIILIVKKELLKFCSNKRLLFATVILPGLVIAILYNVMGKLIAKQEADSQIFKSPIYIINLPSDIESIFKNAGIKWKIADIYEKEDIKIEIENNNENILVCFPDDFDVLSNLNSGSCPNIEIYYNASSTESMKYFLHITEILTTYEDQISNVFDINRDNEVYNLATEKESMAKNIAMILPTLLMGLIYSACMPIAAESIAGEKEHGTIATLLVTPIRRYNIAIGKIISLSIMALGGAVSSYIGTIYSLPQFLNISGEDLLKVYGLKEYIYLFFTLLSVIMLMVSVMSLVSANAKSIKEASTILSPFAAVVMILGMTCMIQDDTISQKWIYFIPLYNNIQEIYNILNFETDLINWGIMFASNLIYAGICVFILGKMLNNEKIMFS